jgi:hypothetical protein
MGMFTIQFDDDLVSGYTKEVDDIFKMLSPPIMTFITNLPAIEGTVA